MINKLKVMGGIGVLILILPAPGIGENPPESDTKTPAQTSFQLHSSVLGAAGTPVAGGVYKGVGTLGQPMPTGVTAGSGNTLHAGFWSGYLNTRPTSVPITPEPLVNQLFQNFPNPFNPTTTIKYSVAKSSPVTLTIYNVAGQIVKRLVDEHKPPGRYQAIWNGANDRGEVVASGIYFYSLRIGSFTEAKKMVILK